MWIHAENSCRNNESKLPTVLKCARGKELCSILQFQKRWFTLENDRLSYYENVLVRIKELLIAITELFHMQDAHPLGEILLGSVAEGFSLEESINIGEFAFALHTPKRVFPLIPVPENRMEKAEWVTSLQQVLHEPPASPSSPSMRFSTYELDKI